MTTDQRMHERESWRMIEPWPKNGARNQSPLSDKAVDGHTAIQRAAWQQVIDQKLNEWQRNPGQLDEPDTLTPSQETIQRALALAGVLSKEGCAAPTRIVPDAHGGIVFERKEKGLFESIRISADGSVEHCVFQDGRLVRREPWPVQFDDNL